MSEKILNLNEQIEKRTIVRDDNRIVIFGKNEKLTIFLNKYIPKKLDFIFHPIKYKKFKKYSYGNSLTKNIETEDCSLILLGVLKRLSIKRLSPEDILKRIHEDIVNSKNFQYSFTSNFPFSYNKSSTAAVSYIFILKN